MARQLVELELGLGAEYETSVPDRPVKSGYLGRAFVSMLHDLDMAAIEICLAEGDGTLCIFGPTDKLSEQLREAADAVAAIGGALLPPGAGPTT